MDAAAFVALAALALWSQRRALGVFFSPDDAIKLERARGLLPAIDFPWRWLTGTWWPRAGGALFGLDPVPWHMVNLGLHAACTVLLWAWARSRGLSRPAALLAAGLFAASRFAFAVLHQVVGIEDLAALAFALLGLLAFSRAGRARVAAGWTCFALAVLGKETMAFVPIVLLLPAPGAPATWAARARHTALAMAPSLAGLAALALARAGTRVFGDGAYASAAGPHVVRNLLLYASWVADLRSASPGAANVATTASAVTGTLVLAAMGALAWFARRRVPAAASGALFFGLALLPVLPLLRQVQAHYLYLPLAGAACVAGAALDAWAGGAERRAARAGLLAVALIVAHAGAADLSAAARFAVADPAGGLPGDPWLRKSEALRHLVADLGPGLERPHERVALFLPPEMRVAYSARTGAGVAADTAGLPRYVLAREVSDEGRALRVFHPVVDSVAWTAGWDRGLADAPWFVVESGAHLRPLGRGLAAQEAYATLATDNGHPEAAVRQLQRVLATEDANPRLHYLLARAYNGVADYAAMRAELERTRTLARDDETRAAALAALAELDRAGVTAAVRPGAPRAGGAPAAPSRR